PVPAPLLTPALPEPPPVRAPVLEPVLQPAPVPPPAAVPPPAGAEPVAAPTAELVSLALLLSVVADKTGYPVDMLDGGMDLESDLGIDSIKKVEIFAAVRQRTEGLPPTDSPQMAQLFQARTLDEVLRRVSDDPA